MAAHQLPVANTIGPLFAIVGSPVSPEVFALIVAPSELFANSVNVPGAAVGAPAPPGPGVMRAGAESGATPRSFRPAAASRAATARGRAALAAPA